mmetsp:Transcript_24781/g.37768  ORF Transcript_24781/g.37768 Transcript_24781/m.37768 type:complete len:867 (-) Transcript_24781:60-2660(-)
MAKKSKSQGRRTKESPPVDCTDVEQPLRDVGTNDEEEKEEVEPKLGGEAQEPQQENLQSKASFSSTGAPKQSNNNTDVVPIHLSKSKIFVLLAALLFLVFAVGFCGGLAGSVIMINKDDRTETKEDNAPSATSSDDGSDDKPTPTPTVSPTASPVAPPMTKQEIQLFLSSVVPDEGIAFSDSTSPQSRALDWVYLDMLSRSGSSTTATSTTRQINPPPQQFHMLQRYVLAVLYYSTNGDGWDNPLGFLSDDPECEWGVSDGYIPTWYGYMDGSLPNPPCNDESNLIALSIGSNDLLGTIPKELALLTDLKFLALVDNPLSSTIPTELAQLTDLQVIRIVNCQQVTGQIPTEFGELRLLDYLDLAWNDLSGTIPTEFGQLTTLSGLWINANPRLGGQVPEQLGLMRSAETISISGTALTGIVPDPVCNIRQGRVQIVSVCDQSQLLCCCCTSCCSSDGGCIGYGGGNICDNEWYDTCSACDVDGPTPYPPDEPTEPPSTDSGSGGPQIPTVPPLIPSQDYRSLQYRVADAEYSKSLDRIIMISSEPNEIHVYNPLTGMDDVVHSLPLSPSCVSVSPDGKYAAVGYNGWVSYVDLTAATTGNEDPVQTFAVSADVSDVVLAGNGYIYAFPRVDQWVSLHSIEIATGIETTHTGYPIREGTRAKLHPSGTKIYGANNGLSPSDFERYDISGGPAEYEYDSPYHGDYDISGDLWMSEDGGRIFVKGRNVFRSSDNRDMDMIYAGSINLRDVRSSIESLDHSSQQGMIVAVPAFIDPIWYDDEASSSLGSDDQIEMYEESFLGHVGTLTLPKFLINNGELLLPYVVHGKFVFFDSTGQQFHVVVQVDANAGMLYDYATISIPTNITDALSI